MSEQDFQQPRQPHGTTQDHGDTGRGIENLDPRENLLGDDPDEVMQTGYNPPDREPHSLRARPTLEEQREGLSVDDYLDAEDADLDPEERAVDLEEAALDPDEADFYAEEFDIESEDEEIAREDLADGGVASESQVSDAVEDDELADADLDAGEQELFPTEERAGRLITDEDYLAHEEEPDGVATDVGPAGYASSAEEAAVYIRDDEEF